MNELCQVRDGTASGNSPLHPLHVNADIYGEQCLIFCQAHFQELVISQLLHRLVLHVFKRIGIVGFINILGKRRESACTQDIHGERSFCMPQQTMVLIQYPLSPYACQSAFPSPAGHSGIASQSQRDRDCFNN